MERDELLQLSGTLLRWASMGRFGSKSVRKEVRKAIQGLMDQDAVKTGAVSRASRDALEEMRAYLEKRLGGAGGTLDAEEALALTRTLMDSTVVREEPIQFEGKPGVRVVVRGRMNLGSLGNRSRILLQDKKHLERIAVSERRSQTFLERFEELEQDNTRIAAEGSAKEKKAFKAALKENVAGLEAQTWFQKMQALWTGAAFSNQSLAIDYINNAIKLMPEYPVYHFFRGNANYYWKQYTLALRDYGEALRLDAKYADAFNNRGNTHSALKDFEAALEDYSKAVKLNTQDAALVNNRANAKYHLNKLKEALKDYGKAVALEPENPVYYNNRGNAWHALEKFPQAVEDYTQALRLAPEYATAQHNRGLAHVALEHWNDALADFNGAIRSDSHHAEAYFQKGKLLQRTGNRGAAEREWRKAAKLGSPEARRLMAKG
ncbi:MAG: tetratricopeptide repeat protein [Deltaproteobacteria bacterium]|nr:tetratricopeptide repeat protein [Deltaproteobacteria bacterium]